MLSSVATALRVLEHLVDEGEAGISEIGRSLDLTIGTVYRMVSTLTQAGYVEQNPADKRYRPGRKIPDLARRMRGSSDFVALARPYLRRMMSVTGETVNLGVLRDGEIVYVERAVTDQPLAVSVSIGSRVPAYCTALGRAVLAFSAPETVGAYLDRLDTLQAGAGPPVPTAAELSRTLQRARAAGFAEDYREFSPDIACVAAPVLDSEGIAQAGVSISVPSTRMSERHAELVPLVRSVGKELSELLQVMGDDRIT